MAAFVLPAIGSGAGWYERGTDNLRNGAYFQASKALAQAIDRQSVCPRASRLASMDGARLLRSSKRRDALAATTIAGDRLFSIARDALYLDAISAIVRRDFKEGFERLRRSRSSPRMTVRSTSTSATPTKTTETGQGAENYLSNSVEQRSIRDRLSTRGDRLSP